MSDESESLNAGQDTPSLHTTQTDHAGVEAGGFFIAQRMGTGTVTHEGPCLGYATTQATGQPLARVPPPRAELSPKIETGETCGGIDA